MTARPWWRVSSSFSPSLLSLSGVAVERVHFAVGDGILIVVRRTCSQVAVLRVDLRADLLDLIRRARASDKPQPYDARKTVSHLPFSFTARRARLISASVGGSASLRTARSRAMSGSSRARPALRLPPGRRRSAICSNLPYDQTHVGGRTGGDREGSGPGITSVRSAPSVRAAPLPGR